MAQEPGRSIWTGRKFGRSRFDGGDGPRAMSPQELKALMEKNWARGGLNNPQRIATHTTRHLHATKNIGGKLLDWRDDDTT